MKNIFHRNESGSSELFGLIILFVFIFSIVLLGMDFFDAVKPVKTIPIVVNVVNVTLSNEKYNGEPDYYINTSDGKVYETTLVGIKAGNEYDFTVTAGNKEYNDRIQSFALVVDK